MKITSGNAFPEIRLFGWSGKFYFPKIKIRWPKKNAFDHGNQFTLLFSLQSISEKWERERERARAIEEKRQTARSRRWSRSCRRSRSTASWDRDLAVAISIAPNQDRDRRRNHWCFFLGCGLCFFEFVFSFFSKHQKIFSGKFFEMQLNTWKYFPFPEISIFGKYVFSGKRFTATKHSQNPIRRGNLRPTTLNCKLRICKQYIYIYIYIYFKKALMCKLSKGN